MDDKPFMRKIAKGIILISIVVPLGIFIWDRSWGTTLFILGLILTIGALHVLQINALESADDDIVHTGGRSTRSDTGRTIYISLVDEQGNELPEAEQKRRIAEAYAKASPRDTVIPIKTKPPD